MSLSEDSNFTQQRSYHAVAILFFYIDALAEKFPELNNQLHAGWLAHFKRPMSAADLDRPPLHGDCAYDANESKWCSETIRYLQLQLDVDGLIKRGLRLQRRPPAPARAAQAPATSVTVTPDEGGADFEHSRSASKRRRSSGKESSSSSKPRHSSEMVVQRKTM